jgi:hypothetical protein
MGNPQQLTMRFTGAEVQRLAAAYLAEAKPDDRERERLIEEEVGPRATAAHCLSFGDFLTICRWKTPRSKSRCRANEASFVENVTRVALTTPSERLRVEVLRLLDGVDWPTASTILHWCHRDPYPILDFRALWSLGVEQPVDYDFAFWQRYTGACRAEATRLGVTMRELDRALWQYSKVNR